MKRSLFCIQVTLKQNDLIIEKGPTGVQQSAQYGADCLYVLVRPSNRALHAEASHRP